MNRLLLCCLLALVADRVPAQTPGADRLAANLRTLQANGLETDTVFLTEFLRRSVVPPETRARIAGLIAGLGADDFEEREKAFATLKGIGSPARWQLRAAALSRDAEVRSRAALLLEALPPPPAEAALWPTVGHVLASRNAPGLAELLLDCLPYAEGKSYAEELAGLLAEAAFAKEGEPTPALVRALRDEEPARRWAAACALVRRAPAAHQKAILGLLDDDHEEVRLRVAVALVRARDRAGIPALIRLVASRSEEVAGEAGELLAHLAGAKGPRRDAAVPAEKLRVAWEGWYREFGAGLDLARIDLDTSGGRTLAGVFRFWNRVPGVLVEFDAAGRVLWEINDVERPIYARKVGHDRVLVCEFLRNQVTERDTTGRVLQTWKLDAPHAYCVERLPTGNTFIATPADLLEFSRTGKEVVRVQRPAKDIVAATVNGDGTFTVVTSGGTCVRLDRKGRETASFPIGKVAPWFGFKTHFLPDGGVVIPDHMADRICEYDRAGKLVAEVKVARPLAVTKLANGNYLYTRDGAMELTEVTPQGRRVLVRPVPVVNNGEGMQLLFAEPR